MEFESDSNQEIEAEVKEMILTLLNHPGTPAEDIPLLHEILEVLEVK